MMSVETWHNPTLEGFISHRCKKLKLSTARKGKIQSIGSALLAQDLLLLTLMVYVTTIVIPDLFKLTYLRYDLACALRALSAYSGVNVYLD